MRKRGLLRVAELAPSKGQRRPGHRGHKPANVVPFERRSVQVVRMFENLQERGWIFRFRAEATSPRGFKYAAEGDSPLEAFLKAFGQWQGDLASLVVKIPEIVFVPKTSAKVQPPPGKRGPQEKTLRRRYRKFIFTRSKAVLIPRPPPVSDTPAWRRAYMREYRRRLSARPVVAA